MVCEGGQPLRGLHRPERVSSPLPRKAWVVLLLIPLLGMVGCSGGSSKKASTSHAALTQVVVTRLEPHTVPIYGEYVGQTEAVSSVEIHAQVTGFLQRIAFKEGSVVKNGQLLFVIDPRPYIDALNQAKATLSVDEATAKNAEAIVRRYTPLEKEHAISALELDSQIATAKEDEADVSQAQAAVAAAQLNVDYTRVTTPMTGQIGVSQVKVGDLIQSGTTLMDTVYSITPMYVTFGVSEDTYLAYQESGRKHPHHHHPIQLILGNGSCYGETGTVNMVAPAVNTQTGTLQIRASFPNPQALLKQGLFVRVRFVTREAKNALLVPQAAIQQLQGTESAYIVGPDNKVKQTTVTTGATVGNDYVVQSGLAAGDLLVVEGIQKVHPGDQVSTKEVAEQIPGKQTAGGTNSTNPCSAGQ